MFTSTLWAPAIAAVLALVPDAPSGRSFPNSANACGSPMPAFATSRPWDARDLFMAASDFTVVPAGSSAWTVNTLVNPTLTLTRGQTYTFDLTAVGPQHPFIINSSASTAGGTIYFGPSFGAVGSFTPDQTMPSTIYYHCQVHFVTMVGQINLVSPVVSVAARVHLEGAYNTGTLLMNDALRGLPAFPLVEPYSAMGYPHVGGGGGEATTAPVLAVAGANAIVDWVVLELRDPLVPDQVVASRSALVQRDGDVVGVDGVSPVSFPVAPGDLHVAVRHRNHLGVMTADPITLSALPAVVDLTTASTVCFGTNARKAIGAVQVLWAGDVNFNGRVSYTGAGNDRDPILLAIGGSVPTLTVAGYAVSDVNMDGTVKYTGSLNDRDPLLVNVGGSVPTAFRDAQLP